MSLISFWVHVYKNDTHIVKQIMTTHVVGTGIKQTSRHKEYHPACIKGSGCTNPTLFTQYESCSKNWDRPMRDWWKDSNQKNSLVAAIPNCEWPDPKLCDIGKGPKGEDPLTYGPGLGATWDKVAPNLKCTYDLDKIITQNQIDSYIQKFGHNDQVMQKFCGQIQKKHCPIDPATNKEMLECTRVTQTSAASTTCKNWFNNELVTKPGIRDAFISSVCGDPKHPDLAECKCADRGLDDIYNMVTKGQEFNDGCWFSPCKTTSHNLISSDMLSPTCPDEVCQQVLQVVDANSVDIKDITSSISCPPPAHKQKYSCGDNGQCELSDCDGTEEENCFVKKSACQNTCIKSAYTCDKTENTCTAIKCDPSTHTNCSETEEKCMATCNPDAKMYKCIDNECHLRQCDPTTDETCHTDKSECQKNCKKPVVDKKTTTYSCVDKKCTNTKCNESDANCYSNSDACAKECESVGLPEWVIWVIVAGVVAVVAIIVTAVLLSRKSSGVLNL